MAATVTAASVYEGLPCLPVSWTVGDTNESCTTGLASGCPISDNTLCTGSKLGDKCIVLYYRLSNGRLHWNNTLPTANILNTLRMTKNLMTILNPMSRDSVHLVYVNTLRALLTPSCKVTVSVRIAPPSGTQLLL